MDTFLAGSSKKLWQDSSQMAHGLDGVDHGLPVDQEGSIALALSHGLRSLCIIEAGRLGRDLGGHGDCKSSSFCGRNDGKTMAKHGVYQGLFCLVSVSKMGTHRVLTINLGFGTVSASIDVTPLVLKHGWLGTFPFLRGNTSRFFFNRISHGHVYWSAMLGNSRHFCRRRADQSNPLGWSKIDFFFSWWGWCIYTGE